MYLDDELAREIIIDIMDIGSDDEDSCDQLMRDALDVHIRDHGVEELFTQIIKCYGPLSRLR